jgi:CheY-like chemotaxis protein
MPELSGPELVQQIRTDKITRDIPCVYMTGSLTPGTPGDQDDPTTVSIAKPFSRAELTLVIDRVLKGK